jgi:hypothetical protein
MQFNIARDKRGDKLGICSCASATASDGLADIVNLCFESPISQLCFRQITLPSQPHLFAVLICDNRACGRACVGTEYDSIFEKAADNSRTGACGFWHLRALALKESIAIGAI